MKIKHLIMYYIILVMLLHLVCRTNGPNRTKIIHKKEYIHDTVFVNSPNIISHVTLTCYQPVKEQCNSEPLITSDGSKINLKNLREGKIKWCAISRDLLYLFSKNKAKMIWIEGFGVYEVRDVMNKRFTHRVDLLIHPKNSIRIKKDDVKIKILK